MRPDRLNSALHMNLGTDEPAAFAAEDGIATTNLPDDTRQSEFTYWLTGKDLEDDLETQRYLNYAKAAVQKWRSCIHKIDSRFDDLSPEKKVKAVDAKILFQGWMEDAIARIKRLERLMHGWPERLQRHDKIGLDEWLLAPMDAPPTTFKNLQPVDRKPAVVSKKAHDLQSPRKAPSRSPFTRYAPSENPEQSPFVNKDVATTDNTPAIPECQRNSAKMQHNINSRGELTKSQLEWITPVNEVVDMLNGSLASIESQKVEAPVAITKSRGSTEPLSDCKTVACQITTETQPETDAPEDIQVPKTAAQISPGNGVQRKERGTIKERLVARFAFLSLLFCIRWSSDLRRNEIDHLFTILAGGTISLGLELQVDLANICTILLHRAIVPGVYRLRRFAHLCAVVIKS